MNQKPTETQVSKSVHPFDFTKPEWEVSRKSMKMESLVVRHDIETPDEVEIPSGTHHFLLLQLSHGEQQVTRISDCKHEGLFAIGELFLQPANHSGFFSWKTTDEAAMFVLKPDFLTHVAEESECLNPDKIELLPIACHRDPKIEHIARCFIEEMQTEGLGGKLYSETLAVQLVIHLLRNYCTTQPRFRKPTGGLSPKKLQAAIDYVQANLDANIRLDDLAKVTKTSSSHFCPMFKRATGLTFSQYIMQQRIELGKRLLRKEELPIVEVAFMSGFCSQSAFTKMFKKYTGVTPKTYQRRL